MRILWILAACIAVSAAAPKPDEDDDDSLRCRKVQVSLVKLEIKQKTERSSFGR